MTRTHGLSHSIVPGSGTDAAACFRQKMLDWYDRHRRVLPWRALPGQKPNPYHVWLSEIMLQQTTVQAVIPYFLVFTEAWPDITDLARAPNEEVMRRWAGLGYYARARNLHRCAQVVVSLYDGHFPEDERTLKTLPGVGDYTAAAIRSIAFGKPSNVVDGNVERVMARYHGIETPLPAGKKIMKDKAALYTQGFDERPGDYAQSLMDLGATICTPKSPACALCPVRSGCCAYGAGTPELYPVRQKKKDRPVRYGYAYWVINKRDEILIQKRDASGLLGGMYGFPTTPWCEGGENIEHPAFLGNAVFEEREDIKHVFTHFTLFLKVFSVQVIDADIPTGHQWVEQSDLTKYGFPTVFDKVYQIVR